MKRQDINRIIFSGQDLEISTMLQSKDLTHHFFAFKDTWVFYRQS
jgi:hypothetical protein